MEPYYFGPDRRLFGVFHPPQGAARSQGVVLCQPIGHEYGRTHRAFRNLAQQLARAGFAVMRFDYSGSGDSQGESGDARLADWIFDLSAAIDELKRRGRVTHVTLVGLRLGAAIAALTAADRRDVGGMVLWDPVISGSVYLQQLIALNEEWLAVRACADMNGSGPSWVVGCPMSDAMRADLAAMNLIGLDAEKFPRIVVFVSDEAAVHPAWIAGIRMLYGEKAVSVVAAAADWHNPETVHTALLPQQILQGITAALSAKGEEGLRAKGEGQDARKTL